MTMAAKDGSMHHSASRARLHDELSANKGGSKVAEMSKPAGPSHPAPSSHSIEDHVDTHGPAHKIEYTHDQASGEHHISSHHGEGDNPEAVHHSRHKTHHAVHAHIKKAMGMQDEEQEERDNESPDQQGEEDEMAETGKGIPGLG